MLPIATPPGRPASVAIAYVPSAPAAYSACTSNSVHSWGLGRPRHVARGERAGHQHEPSAEREQSHDARE